MDFQLLTKLCGNVDELFTAHEFRLPKHFAGTDIDRFKDLFSFRAAEEILTKSLLYPSVIGVVRMGSSFNPQQFSCAFPVGIGGPDEKFTDPSKIGTAFSNGATVLIRGLSSFWPSVKHFAHDLEAEISHPVSINCYLTPPNSSGLSRHYDMHEVLILQVEGAKTWEIGPRGFLNPLEGRNPFEAGERVTEEMTVKLQQGDVLYVPRGYLHRCTAESNPSLHLTIGILTRSRFDILTDFVEESTNNADFRIGMPWGFLRNDHDGRGYQAIDETLRAFGDWAPENVNSVLKREEAVLNKLRGLPDSTVFLPSDVPNGN